jgi:alpha-aminoadipic semialdehyde synthase
LLKEHFPDVRTPYAGFVFEGTANRNSLGYADIYGLGELSDMDTMFRGTLRYQGYSDLLYAFRKLGFLEQSKSLDQCHSWVGCTFYLLVYLFMFFAFADLNFVL